MKLSIKLKASEVETEAWQNSAESDDRRRFSNG